MRGLHDNQPIPTIVRFQDASTRRHKYTSQVIDNLFFFFLCTTLYKLVLWGSNKLPLGIQIRFIVLNEETVTFNHCSFSVFPKRHDTRNTYSMVPGNPKSRVTKKFKNLFFFRIHRHVILSWNAIKKHITLKLALQFIIIVINLFFRKQNNDCWFWTKLESS